MHGARIWSKKMMPELVFVDHLSKTSSVTVCHWTGYAFNQRPLHSDLKKKCANTATAASGRQGACDGLHAAQHDGPATPREPAGRADPVPVGGGAAVPAAAAECVPQHLRAH